MTNRNTLSGQVSQPAPQRFFSASPPIKLTKAQTPQPAVHHIFRPCAIYVQALCNKFAGPVLFLLASPVQYICRFRAACVEAPCDVFAGPMQIFASPMHQFCRPDAIYCQPCPIYLQALCSMFASPVYWGVIYLQALCIISAGPANLVHYICKQCEAYLQDPCNIFSDPVQHI